MAGAKHASPLFRLPKKVRHKIYAHVVAYKNPISIHKHSTNGALLEDRDAGLLLTTWRFTPPLLQTCRQIQDEAAPVFYSSNIFFATIRDADVSEIISWLQETSPAYLSLVKHLIFNIEPSSFADLLEITSTSNGAVIRHQARDLIEAMTKAGFSAAGVIVNIPEMRHMSKDALLMHFDLDDAEKIRRRWISTLEDELDKIEEDGLVDGFKDLMSEPAKD